MEYGLLSFVVLILDVYAILQIFGSTETTGAKVLWTLLVVLLPVVGLIIWAFAGPRGKSAVA